MATNGSVYAVNTQAVADDDTPRSALILGNAKALMVSSLATTSVASASVTTTIHRVRSTGSLLEESELMESESVSGTMDIISFRKGFLL
jgi:hypothetical protein